ncbi:DMT family transporter [Chondromyces apiculatus]|nr:DMT family transporter [Chondromyces apiculatus]
MAAIGELAALGTAGCWVVSSLAFTASARRIGSMTLNLVRLVLALGFLTLFCWLYRGLPLPLDASPSTWGWLSVSGVVGFVLGDLCLFRAFLLVGPRISMLIMSLAPPVAAGLGWIWLGERLSLADLAGMAVTLGGVTWVVAEQQPAPGAAGKAGEAGEAGTATAGAAGASVSGMAGVPSSAPPASLAGLALAALGALGQAVGMVLSKRGMGTYDAFAATQIRVLAAIAVYAALFVAIRWWGQVAQGVRDRAGMGFAALGALAGPFVGVSLSLVSIQHTSVGVATTLMSTTPVLIIPAVMVLHRERVSLRAALGAALAVGGVALLWVR